MDHASYLTALREESEGFLEALTGADLAAPVPTCDGWTAADLLWHLTVVQHAWARVVADDVPRPDVAAPARPDDGDLLALAATTGTELLLALQGHDPAEPRWTWHPEGGGSVGWIARRQTHEALVHRVDADLTVGRPVRPPVVDLAVDGVDEVLHGFLGLTPAWGTVTPDGTRVRVLADREDRSWLVRPGRLTGTSPRSGRTYDLDAAVVDAEDDGGPVDLTVAGHAWDLDRWAWGRGDGTELRLEGDPALAQRLRALLARATG